MSTKILAAKTNLSDIYAPGKNLGGSEAKYGDLLTPLFQNAIILIGILSFFVFLLAGFRYITSGGDENKIKEARATLNYAIIGTALAGGSYLLINILSGITNFKFLGA